MERGSNKHGPRLDDQMSQEVSGLVQGPGVGGSRVDEFREAEPAGEDQPGATTAPAGELRTGAPQGMSSTDVEQRSRLGRFIGLSALPGDRETLLGSARENEAPDDVIAALERLPAGTRYRTVSEVWAALGHKNETQRW
ncbi:MULTISPECIES: DUF2795 domain-containing protein [Micromonospora]|uniref:DUF2795 domain-containing protein n=2 Tax=Micromonospora TaxID=1873 RepID=A0A1C6SLL1_9ACTN|nr:MULTISPECIES: DUF2795 domain-containing protein [Micromonospora]TWJ30151.1 uncharacterized protein DUF2795 [Micromonospora sagamiensis]BCL16817.1 hypothetical protein GCM10017556_45560 [Micromonospora sagamiensis]SCL30089.1 Protein of unknown function [Micromonospora inyonensis]